MGYVFDGKIKEKGQTKNTKTKEQKLWRNKIYITFAKLLAQVAELVDAHG